MGTFARTTPPSGPPVLLRHALRQCRQLLVLLQLVQRGAVLYHPLLSVGLEFAQLSEHLHQDGSEGSQTDLNSEGAGAQYSA